MNAKRLLYPLVLFTLMLGACAPATANADVFVDEALQQAEPYADVDAERAVELGAAVEGQSAAESDLAVVVPAADDRVILKNASLTLEVEHPAAQVNAIMRLAEEMGGFVVTSNVYAQASSNGYQVPSAEITIRVPADQFNRVLAELEGDANQVITRSVTGQDVTQQYTDLQSRLRNLEEAAAQLQQIMDEADDTVDVLAVYNELVRVNEQAEVLRGQIKYYAEAAAYSAISIQLRAPAPVVETPAPRPAWQRAFENASEALGEMWEATVGLAIWLGVFLLPTALIYLSPFALLIVLIRWWKQRRAAQPAAAAGD